MTNKQINKRLMKLEEAQGDLSNDIDSEIERLEASQKMIQISSGHFDLNEKEQRKYDKIQKRIEALENIRDYYLGTDFEDNLLEEGEAKEEN